jgi:hypothetical protein
VLCESVVCIFFDAELFVCGCRLGAAASETGDDDQSGVIGSFMFARTGQSDQDATMENFALDATHKGGLTISHYLDCSPNVVSVFKEVNKLVLVVTIGLVSVSLLRTFRPSTSRASS